MALTISIKTSQTANTPASLANGEIAYSYASDKFFIGKTPTADAAPVVTYIGGKLLVDKVANLENVLFEGHFGESGFEQLKTDKLVFSANSNFTENGILYVKNSGVVDFVGGSSSAGKFLTLAANGLPFFDDINGGFF